MVLTNAPKGIPGSERALACLLGREVADGEVRHLAGGDIGCPDPAARIADDDPHRGGVRRHDRLQMQFAESGRNRSRLRLRDGDGEPVDGVVDQLTLCIERGNDAKDSVVLVAGLLLRKM